MKELKDRIIKHEGHMILPQDNIQIGNKYSKEYLTELFDKDFNIAVKGANKLIQEKIPHLLMLGLTEAELSLIEGVLVEMVFQMGRPRVSKFKKMFNAIDEADWNKAADEMLDSRWAKQTFERALNLSSIIRSLL